MHATLPPPNQVAPAQATPAKGLAIAAMVCGIVGTTIGLVPLFGLFALALGVVGLVLGLIATRAQKRAGVRRGIARAGWITGAVAIGLGVIGLSIVSATLNDLEQDLNELQVEP